MEEADRIAQQVHHQIHEAVGCSYCVIHVDAAPPEAGPVAEKTEGIEGHFRHQRTQP